MTLNVGGAQAKHPALRIRSSPVGALTLPAQRRVYAALALCALLSLPRVAGAEGNTPAWTSNDAPVEVTVQGTRVSLLRGARDETAASSVVLRAELEAPGTTSADVLARIPGVTVQRAGSSAEYATASVRGAESRQIPIYLAGIRINDDVDGSADLSTLPLWMVQHIEVYRGNSPQVADRSGLAGAIFFEPLHAHGPALGANVGVGSYGERNGWLSGTTGNARASSLVAVRAARADNNYLFTNDRGQRFQLEETRERRVNADFTDVDAWSVSDFVLPNDVRVSLVLNALDRAQGAASLAATPSHRARAHLRRLLGGLSASIPCDEASRCKVTLSTSALISNSNTSDPLQELRTSHGSSSVARSGKRTQQAGHLELRPWDVLKLNVSTEHAHETLDIQFERFLPQNARRIETSAAVNALFFPDARVSPQLMLRGRCESTSAAFVSLARTEERDAKRCTLAPPDARLGLRVNVTPGVQLLTNASSTTLSPTLGELYGINPTTTGNPELIPEKSLNADVGALLQYNLNRDFGVALDAFAFWRSAKNLIRYERTSLNSVSPFNEAKARIFGVEGRLALTLFRILSSSTSFTALDPKRVDARAGANETLTLTPRLTLSQSLTIAAPIPSLGVERAATALFFTRTSSRYADRAGFVVLPSQLRLDASASVSLKSPSLSLRFLAENITNRQNQDLLGLPLPGRSFHASIEAWWK